MRRNKKPNQFTENDYLLEGGDAAEPKASSKAKTDSKKPKSSKKASSNKAEEEKKEDDEDPWSAPVKAECCCCFCVCSTENSVGTTCCGCFPIKCGAVSIGIFTLVITTILFIWNYFLFLNEYLHWWYTLVCLVCLLPLLVAANFVISWFIKDTRITRLLLWNSQLLALISTSLLCGWQLIYFIVLYKRPDFYQGQGDLDSHTYTKINKKNYIFFMLFESLGMIIFFAYFMCATSAYCEAMHGPEEEEEAEVPVEESKKPSSKAKTESKKPSAE